MSPKLTLTIGVFNTNDSLVEEVPSTECQAFESFHSSFLARYKAETLGKVKKKSREPWSSG